MMRLNPNHHSRILSLIPGRVRIHLPAWEGDASTPITETLVEIDGIHTVEANPITRNVLVRFDPQRVDPEMILFCLQPFGALDEEQRQISGLSLVEQIRTFMTLMRLVGQINSTNPLQRAGRSLALEGGFFMLTLLFDHLAVPRLGIKYLPLLLDLIALGAIVTPRIPKPALAMTVV